VQERERFSTGSNFNSLIKLSSFERVIRTVKLLQSSEQQISQNLPFKSVFGSSQFKNHQSEIKSPQRHHQEHYRLLLTSIASLIGCVSINIVSSDATQRLCDKKKIHRHNNKKNATQ
jgi:hypothetical protein